MSSCKNSVTDKLHQLRIAALRIVNKPDVIRSILVISLVSAVGILLALQGWKSRIPTFDILRFIADAHELVMHGQIPDKGTLTSMASYTPPGTTWLIAPGMLLFTDPRLFEYVGSVILYIGTLAGILLLARSCFGKRCAFLAVGIYGLSSLGLGFAGSLWPRGHPFFTVWMVYWIVLWVARRDAKYLAAAIVTWAAGMYVFMEIAPAVFIPVIVWFFYRPPIRVRPLFIGGLLIVVIWYPYLRFEFGRSFADLRSQVFLQGLLPDNLTDSWCDLSLVIQTWGGTTGTLKIEAGENSLLSESKRSMLIGGLKPILRRGIAIVNGLFANFDENAHIPGTDVIVLFLVLAILAVLFISRYFIGSTGSTGGRSSRRYWLTAFAIFLLISGVVMNEFIIARYLIPNGVLTAAQTSSIRRLQELLVLSGIVILSRRRIDVFLNRLAMPGQMDFWNLKRPGNAKVLLVSLVVPWLILCLIAEPYWPERYWWLWPLQVIFIAAFTIQLTSWVRAPIGRIGQILIIGILLCNPDSLAKIDSWYRTGWEGSDAAEVQVIDYVSKDVHSNGKDQAAIGFQTFFWGFMAQYNIVDPGYKVGADWDLMFQYRQGVLNTNHCAEGVSPQDEYRIVQTSPGEYSSSPTDFIAFSPDQHFYLLKQFGPYGVYKYR